MFPYPHVTAMLSVLTASPRSWECLEQATFAWNVNEAQVQMNQLKAFLKQFPSYCKLALFLPRRVLYATAELRAISESRGFY